MITYQYIVIDEPKCKLDHDLMCVKVNGEVLASAAHILKTGMIQRRLAWIQHSFGSVGHSNQGRKRIKRNPDRKRRSETLPVCR